MTDTDTLKREPINYIKYPKKGTEIAMPTVRITKLVLIILL